MAELTSTAGEVYRTTYRKTYLKSDSCANFLRWQQHIANIIPITPTIRIIPTTAVITRATPARVAIGFPVHPMAAGMRTGSAETAEASPAAARYPATICN
ncbi:hypothetical protein CLM73_25830 [Achromobacter spanius]|uniref:Uncharacterized protein n=1 Tax=Achromobacter spanius TaxID=217203 RepID=A0A2S0IE10_9BURK|nr:hypothetical protein CLM73_25830 [Achromobacter spanius]